MVMGVYFLLLAFLLAWMNMHTRSSPIQKRVTHIFMWTAIILSLIHMHRWYY